MCESGDFVSLSFSTFTDRYWQHSLNKGLKIHCLLSETEFYLLKPMSAKVVLVNKFVYLKYFSIKLCKTVDLVKSEPFQEKKTEKDP